jgi:hypothetical protein
MSVEPRRRALTCVKMFIKYMILTFVDLIVFMSTVSLCDHGGNETMQGSNMIFACVMCLYINHPKSWSLCSSFM